MVAAPAVAHDVGVPRLLVAWSRPYHLAPEEASRWVRGEAGALLSHAATRSAELRRLHSASPRHGCDWDWLLELDVGGPIGTFVEDGICAEWLGDLRLLGMRPQVMVVGETVALERHRT
jgi:hypothetical protein